MTFSKLLAQSLLWRGLYFITLFCVNVMLSRTLGASGSGIVFYIANTFAFVQVTVSLSLENGITFYAASRQMIASHLLWLCLLWTCVVVVVQLLVFYFTPFFDKTTLQYGFYSITGWLLITYASNLFYAGGNFVMPNVILSCFNVLFVLFIWFHKSASQHTIALVYFSFFLLEGLILTLFYIIQNQSWRAFALPAREDGKRFFRYSLTVLLFNVLLFLVYRIDYYFVRYSAVCSATDLGNYIQASKLGQMLLVVPQIIGSAVYPQVSSGKELASVSRIILFLMKLIALLFFMLFVVVLMIGKWLFPFLLGATFQHVQVPFLLLLPGVYGLAIISFVSNFFSGQGNVNISLRAALLALLVVVTGDVLFVLQYGINAAAMVSSLGYLVMFSVYFFRFKQQSHLRMRDFFRLNTEDVVLMKEWIGNKKL